MITVRARLAGFAQGVSGVGANSEDLLRRAQMERLGQIAIAAIRKRCAAGMGAGDAPFPALSAKHSAVKHNGKFVRQRVPYSQWKAAHGLAPTRDLVGTGKDGGHMLDNLSVRQATPDKVVMSFTQRKARVKALANEKRTPFLSLDGSVAAAVLAEAGRMFADTVVAKITAMIFRRKKAA